MKNKLLPEIKGSENTGVASYTRGAIKGFSLTWLNLIRASLLSFPCWLLSDIKVHYINTK